MATSNTKTARMSNMNYTDAEWVRTAARQEALKLLIELGLVKEKEPETKD